MKISHSVILLIILSAACQNSTITITPPSSPSIPNITKLPTDISPPETDQAIPTQDDLGVNIPTGCTTISPRPSPGPTEQSLFPPVNESDWIFGATDVNVTIIEYGDFQCPNCVALAPVLKQIQTNFPADVRIVYRYYPLISIHDKAALSAQAAEAAGRQGKFWEMHDLLFDTQKDWADMPLDTFTTWIYRRAKNMKLDEEKFKSDLTSPEVTTKIQDAWTHNLSIQMPGTPFLLLNGQIWPNNLPVNYYSIADYISLELLGKRQFTSCPPMELKIGVEYYATLHTEKGDIVIQLFGDQTPIAVNNFIFLARQGWYDGVTFHRVLEGFVAQAGDPSGTGYGSPGYTFINEDTMLKFDQPGLVAMANAGRDTNGSQFFITSAPASHLDGGYTIFGAVVSGMNIVEGLKPRDPSVYPPPPPGDKIINVTIVEK